MEEQYEVPLSEDIFCFVSLFQSKDVPAKFYTLFVAPLLRLYINPGVNVYESRVGVHRFLGQTDRSMYLVPYDLPECSEYGKKEEYSLGVDDPCQPKSIIVPMEFDLRIAQYFKFKITDGKLYKREEGEAWQIVQI